MCKQLIHTQHIGNDCGRDNIEVARFMIRHRRNGKSMLTESSDHNQRIKQLWRDLYQSVTHIYRDLLYFVEVRGNLDPLNEKHLFALHHVFLPRLDVSFRQWCKMWTVTQFERHRTEHLVNTDMLW